MQRYHDFKYRRSPLEHNRSSETNDSKQQIKQNHSNIALQNDKTSEIKLSLKQQSKGRCSTYKDSKRSILRSKIPRYQKIAADVEKGTTRLIESPNNGEQPFVQDSKVNIVADQTPEDITNNRNVDCQGQYLPSRLPFISEKPCVNEKQDDNLDWNKEGLYWSPRPWHQNPSKTQIITSFNNDCPKTDALFEKGDYKLTKLEDTFNNSTSFRDCGGYFNEKDSDKNSYSSNTGLLIVNNSKTCENGLNSPLPTSKQIQLPTQNVENNIVTNTKRKYTARLLPTVVFESHATTNQRSKNWKEEKEEQPFRSLKRGEEKTCTEAEAYDGVEEIKVTDNVSYVTSTKNYHQQKGNSIVRCPIKTEEKPWWNLSLFSPTVSETSYTVQQERYNNTLALQRRVPEKRVGRRKIEYNHQKKQEKKQFQQGRNYANRLKQSTNNYRLDGPRDEYICDTNDKQKEVCNLHTATTTTFMVADDSHYNDCESDQQPIKQVESNNNNNYYYYNKSNNTFNTIKQKRQSKNIKNEKCVYSELDQQCTKNDHQKNTLSSSSANHFYKCNSSSEFNLNFHLERQDYIQKVSLF